MRLLLLGAAALLSSLAWGQIAHDGQPMASGSKWGAPSFVTTPTPNLAQLAAQDDRNDQDKAQPWRFGINYDVHYHPGNSGTLTQVAGGTVWRLGIHAPGAVSINLLFEDYNVPAGARVFMYTPDQQIVRGAFTEENNKAHGALATDVVEGDSLIVEYFYPGPISGIHGLGVKRITYGYRGLDKFKGYGDSGACNNNVNCPVGVPWSVEKRSVAIILVGGNGACTGAMVNNTANNGTPYFLTADHCLGGSVANWVFRFNWEAPTCANANPTNMQTVSGSTLRASNGGSDFALLELSSAPPASYNVYYAGWDKSGNTPSEQVAIHHPSGDIKKISFDDDPAQQALWGGAQCWHILDWEDGTTEPGSSGSPLFDQNHRIIGQLYGGTASCSNNIDDYYGRFDVSWDGTSASTRLKDWLDPGNIAVDTLDGYDPNSPTMALDASSTQVLGIGSVVCDSTVDPELMFTNRGFDTLTSVQVHYQLNAAPWQTSSWTGSLLTLDSDTVSLPSMMLVNGLNTLTVAVSAPNGGVDGNPLNDTLSLSFTAFPSGTTMTVEIQTDDYPGETTWEIVDSVGTVIYQGGPYSNPNTNHLEVLCLGDGCYDFIIYDSYGDGICCAFGTGYVNLLDQNGAVMASHNGQFNLQATVPFCMSGCSFSDNPSLDDPTCFDVADGSIQLAPSGGTGTNYTYSWSNGSNTASIFNLLAGTYTCTITNDGCSVVNSYTLNNPAPFVPTINQNGFTLFTNASGTYQWFRDGVQISGANTSSYLVTQNGTYTVQVTDINGCIGLSSGYVVSNISWEGLQLAGFTAFPQPTSERLNLRWESARNESLQIQVSNVLGQLMYEGVISMEAGSNEWALEVRGWATGTYHLHLIGAEGNKGLSFIVK